MALIILGTLYNPRQSGIPWSQPGGPGTIVYPQQQINIPWANYPVPGQFFIEASGLFVAGCGHWMDYPHIFMDDAGIIATLIYLQDSTGQVWQVAVTNAALIQTIPVSLTSAPTSIPINDSAISQTWAMSVLPLGDLKLTAVSTQFAPQQYAEVSPNGSIYAIQVSNGDLQTAYPSPSLTSAMALVTCALCTYIQYTMPIAQFYSTFQDPITII